LGYSVKKDLEFCPTLVGLTGRSQELELVANFESLPLEIANHCHLKKGFDLEIADKLLILVLVKTIKIFSCY
ncbi:hypothetical protein N9Q46_00500, partial [bacterium]|nr:hypothetical protein [bacterium]